jgi:D-alanyl-D-alanine-carboxypeptidase/D-alanyl-D-alanine-endopeptidase
MRTARCLPILFRVVACLVLSIAVTSAAWADESGAIPSDVQEAIRARVDSGQNVGIVIGVVTPNGTSFYSCGTMTADGNVPVDETTLFEIGSAAKPLTGLLLADAVERGDLSLDDVIDADLPSTVVPPSQRGRSIRYRDLATHTSGLPSIPENLDPADWNNPYADYTVDQLYEAISGFVLTTLGTYEYSNLAFGLLGHLLELRYGASYEDLVIDRICDALGMPDTRATLSDEQRSRTATGYRDGEAFPIWANPTLAGAGCLLSTVKDLAVFVAASLGLIESPLHAAMQLTQQPHAYAYAYGGIPIGLGWHILDWGGKRIVEHHGSTGGCWSYVGFVVEDQIGVVVLTNTYANSDDLGIHILDPTWPLEE